jgi:transcriptional antiterminator NusG
LSGAEEAAGVGKIFAVRTTMGRELDVALVIARRAEELIAKGEDPGISSIVIPPNVRGYVFFEVEKLASLYRLVSEVKYVKASRPVKVSPEELEKLIMPKPVVESISVGDVVEIIRGPFRGMKAQVTGIDRNKNMLTVNILEAAFAIPISIPSDYVKQVKKGE